MIQRRFQVTRICVLPNANQFYVNRLAMAQRVPVLARRLRRYLKPRGRAWTCGGGSGGTDGGFYENVHSARESLFALASFPLWAQQSPPANQPNSPAAQQSPSSTEPASVKSSANPQAPAAQMSPVNGELVNKLDSKTAKSGDSVIVQRRGSRLRTEPRFPRDRAGGSCDRRAAEPNGPEFPGGAAV